MNLIKVIFFFFVLIIISCKKTDNTKIDPESGLDYVQTEYISANIFQVVSDAVQYDTLSKIFKNDSIPPCMHISSLPGGSTYPKTVTIDFDSICNKGIISYDGATYSGIITARLSGPLKTTGTKIFISSSNLSFNGYKISFNDSIINNTGSGNITFKMVVNNGIISGKNGIIHYSSSEQWTWTKGESTDYPIISDDIYHVTGHSNGSNIDNSGFSTQTLTPLIIQASCVGKLVKGKVQVIPQNAQIMTIDYGDSICSGKANMLIGNHASIPIIF